ncbi:MAG: E3 binding domain-containing protein, partial [Gammaproteobacteria bacterium]|nr:E3 binding domain-containing protein [Gammaproteobacteria bacterium]
MTSRHEVRVPDLGDFDDVEVVEVMVAVGDEVSKEDPLITLETDKAAMEVPSTAEGTVTEISVATGARVSEGDLVVVIEVTEAEVAPDEGAPQKSAQEDHKPAAVAAVSTGPVSVLVPDLGDFAEAEIIEVQVQAGDAVAIDDSVITLETDKAAMEVPSTVAGKILSVAVEVGQKVGQGVLIMEVEAEAGSAAAAAPAPAATPSAPSSSPGAPAPKSAPPTPIATAAPKSLPPINEATFGKAHASPSVRKFARELGVNLAQVTGTGQKTRVMKEDVKAFVKLVMSGQASAGGGSALPALPEVDFAKFGEIEIKPLSRIQKISGPRLHASWVNIPHVTQQDETDITDLEARRQSL